jgi:hypothetical protein
MRVCNGRFPIYLLDNLIDWEGIFMKTLQMASHSIANTHYKIHEIQRLKKIKEISLRYFNIIR